MTSRKKGRNRETARAARNPAYIARPPIVGVGFGWMLRSVGWSIAPAAITNRRTNGVATKVTAKAVRKSLAYASNPALTTTATDALTT